MRFEKSTKQNSITQRSIFLILDNIRFGGIQRLALDEAYALADLGLQVKIIVLEPPLQVDNMTTADSDFYESYSSSLQVFHLEGKKVEAIRNLVKLIKKHEPALVVCHSAKAMPLSKIARQISFKKSSIKILGYVHQLISLSSFEQRIKRLLYFNFVDELRASSQQFIDEIEFLRRRNFLLRLLSRKSIQFDRMGVNVRRINALKDSETTFHNLESPTLIFLSRVVAWKGFDRYLAACQLLDKNARKIVFTSQIYWGSNQLSQFTQLENAEVITNSQIAKYASLKNPVHLYPTNYGPEVNYQQNIGMNVLECLVLGIPNLISKENFRSWPELKNSILVEETDWEPREVINMVERLARITELERKIESEKLSKVVSIDDHIKRITSHLI